MWLWCAVGFFGGIVGGYCLLLLFWGFLGVGLFVSLKNLKLIWPENTVFEVKWQDLASAI